MAIIVIVAVIFLGGRLIGGLTATACGASDVDFQNDLRRTLDAYSVYGSRATVELDAPCDVQQLCFIDAIEIGNTAFESAHPSIQNAIRTGVKRNVFLIRDQGLMDLDYDERIMVERLPGEDPGGELCVDVQSDRFSFVVEGFGRFVKVSP